MFSRKNTKIENDSWGWLISLLMLMCGSFHCAASGPCDVIEMMRSIGCVM